VVVRNYTEGTLIVDLIDANTKQLAWRAYPALPAMAPMIRRPA
jgi:hypothetical protein